MPEAQNLSHEVFTHVKSWYGRRFVRQGGHWLKQCGKVKIILLKMGKS